MTDPFSEFLLSIAKVLFDKKAQNILVLDSRGSYAFADAFIVGEGSSTRHVQSLSDYVEEAMEKLGRRPWYVEGRQHGDWIAMDYGDCIIHLFAPDQRERYSFDQLWHACKIVPLPFWKTEGREGMKKNEE